MSLANEHADYATLDLSFDPTVEIKEYFYPEFSLQSFLSDVGGILGLWLGVGVVQLSGYIFDVFEIIKRIKTKLSRNRQNKFSK